MEDNTASECVRTVATAYGCKIVQLYEYNAKVYGYNANKNFEPCWFHKFSNIIFFTLDDGTEIFLVQLSLRTIEVLLCSFKHCM